MDANFYSHLSDEIWKPIARFNGEYEVSDMGRVRSTHKVIVRSCGKPYTRISRVLRPAIDAVGYMRIAVSFKGSLITCKVHRLVAEAFIDNPENKPTVNHKWGNKLDNRASELEWATCEEQTEHAIRTGLIKMEYTPDERRQSVNRVIKRGSLNGCSKLTEAEALEIRRKFVPTVYTREMLSKEFKVTIACIKNVLSRKTWKHV